MLCTPWIFWKCSINHSCSNKLHCSKCLASFYNTQGTDKCLSLSWVQSCKTSFEPHCIRHQLRWSDEYALLLPLWLGRPQFLKSKRWMQKFVYLTRSQGQNLLLYIFSFLAGDRIIANYRAFFTSSHMLLVDCREDPICSLLHLKWRFWG